MSQKPEKEKKRGGGDKTDRAIEVGRKTKRGDSKVESNDSL